jgi:serine protease Do
MSLKKYLPWLVLILSITNFVSADTIQLKDKAAITGTILAEKPDALVLDVGYTVLIVPRSSISSISKTGLTTTPLTPIASNALASIGFVPQFYYSTLLTSPARDVSSLVKQIGEAVVQVRTPEGLGSGFFINADGYLITNFHVIEGETEISV